MEHARAARIVDGRLHNPAAPRRAMKGKEAPSVQVAVLCCSLFAPAGGPGASTPSSTWLTKSRL